MSDRLKDFIENNRESFDSYEPGDLWSGINESMKLQSQGINIKNISNMFKYGFGASAVVIGTFLVVNSQMNKTTVREKQTVINVEPVSQPAKAVAVSPGATLFTEIKKEEEKPETPSSAKNILPSIPNITNSIQKPSITVAPEPKEEIPAEVPTAKKEDPIIPSCSKTASVRKNEDSLSDARTAVDTVFKGIKMLDVRVEYCNVTVKGNSGNEVRMKGEIGDVSCETIVFGTRSYKKSEFIYRYEKKDSILKVWVERKDLKHKVRVNDEDKKATYLDFEVPAKTNVHIDNGSGNINVSDLEGKTVELKTSFGHIKAEDVKSSFEAKSSSGNISLKNVTGNLKSSTSFGHQVLENITGSVRLRSSSGNITVRVLKGDIDAKSSFGHQKYETITGDITSVASSGNVVIKDVKGKVNSTSSFGRQHYTNVEGDITSFASSGSIEIESTKGNLSVGTSFGNISGKDVMLLSNSEFKTSSGNIRMCLLNDMKDLRFDLHASSGNLTVEKGNIKSRSDESLSVGEGGILIKGISTFGNQNYK